ncbi:MAG: hypothetical protein RIE77_10225 [Phycisphaerales bacterium]|jgi:hypothetical protein
MIGKSTGIRREPSFRAGTLAAAVLLGGLVVAIGGCAGGSPEPSGVDPDEGRSLFGGGGSSRDAGDWTIVLAAFRGEEAPQAARFALGRVSSEFGLTEARLEERGDAIVLAYGRFEGPGDPRAASELERLQNIERQDVKPFEQALLTPPQPRPGSNPQYDLLNVRQAFGAQYAYTLQIGSYGRSDGRQPSESERREARQAAERAVATLRSEGEQAFYFHGPNFSSVTVGLFRADDVDPQTGLRSAAFYDLQQKFPYNLLNGAQRTVKLEGSAAQAQRSVLVRIPSR